MFVHGKQRVILQNGAQRSIKLIFLKLHMSVSIVWNGKHALHKCGKSETFTSWKKNMQKRLIIDTAILSDFFNKNLIHFLMFFRCILNYNVYQWEIEIK